MKTLPAHIRPYSRTATFTQDTAPPGLLKDHRTKDTVWALIQVLEGKLEYAIGTDETHILEPGRHGVIEPQVPHHVKPLGPVSFFVEFYK